MEADSCYQRSCVPADTQHKHMRITHRKMRKAIKKDGILRMEGISEHPKQSLEEFCEEHCPSY